MKKSRKNFSRILRTVIITAIAILLAITAINIIYIYFAADASQIPDKIPDEMALIINQSLDLDNLAYAKKMFSIVDDKYTSPLLGYLKYPGRIMNKEIFSLWATKGYLPCDKQNFIYSILLVKSGKFNPKDIEEKWLAGIIPHQYIILNVSGEVYEVDLWGADHNADFGSYALKKSLIHFKL
jgi:hypothetical protein